METTWNHQGTKEDKIMKKKNVLMKKDLTAAHVCMPSVNISPSLSKLSKVTSIRHFSPNLVHPCSHSATRTVPAVAPPHLWPGLPAQAMSHWVGASWSRRVASVPISA